MRVLSGRGGELEGGFSFGVARQLFEPLLAAAAGAERAALLAGAARRAPTAMEDAAGAAPSAAAVGDPPFAVVHGLYWLAVNASEAGPVLVAIDDLHWADQASLRFVLYLADRLAGLPVALLLAGRTGEVMAAEAADCLARLEQIAGSVVSPGALSRETMRPPGVSCRPPRRPMRRCISSALVAAGAPHSRSRPKTPATRCEWQTVNSKQHDATDRSVRLG